MLSYFKLFDTESPARESSSSPCNCHIVNSFSYKVYSCPNLAELVCADLLCCCCPERITLVAYYPCSLKIIIENHLYLKIIEIIIVAIVSVIFEVLKSS